MAGGRRGFLGWLLGGMSPEEPPAERPAHPPPDEGQGGAPEGLCPAQDGLAGPHSGEDGGGSPTIASAIVDGPSRDGAKQAQRLQPDDDLFDEAPVFIPPASRKPPVPPAAPPRRLAAIRPPGALAPGAFEAACTRCGACVDACPPSAIVVRGADPYPRLLPAETPCERCHDLPCIRSCPTGALRPLPVAAVRIGLAVVHARLCLNTATPDGCDHCLDQCPVSGALVAGPGGVPVVSPDLCVGCGLCARYCRAVPGAISVSGPRGVDISG